MAPGYHCRATPAIVGEPPGITLVNGLHPGVEALEGPHGMARSMVVATVSSSAEAQEGAGRRACSLARSREPVRRALPGTRRGDLEGRGAARALLHFDADRHVIARVTPLAGPTFLLEAPWRDGWSEAKRGAWRAVLGALDRDTRGTFHGLESLAGKGKAGSTVQKKLRALGVPVPVLAEPREWYVRHRKPSIVETDRGHGRVLVEFSQVGTCAADRSRRARS